MAVDASRWVTYGEAATLLGLSGEATKRLSLRQGWPRRAGPAGGTLVAVPDGLNAGPPMSDESDAGQGDALQAVAMTLAVPHGYGASLGSLAGTLWGPASAAATGTAVSTLMIARFPGSVASAVAASALGGGIYLTLLFAIDGRALRDDIVGLTRVVRRRPALRPARDPAK